MSQSSSSPHRRHSRQSHTISTPPISRAQAELLDLVAAEIDDQTYQFPPDEVARMLSPKRLKDGLLPLPQPLLKDFDCLIDETVVKDAMKQVPELKVVNDEWDTNSERQNYESIAKFLNTCVQECNNVYGVIHQKLASQEDHRFSVVAQTERWLPGLRFAKYDKATGDGIHNASALKPDFVGLDDVADSNPEDFLCWWSLPSHEIAETGKGKKRKDIPDFEIAVPGEVKGDWKVMVQQAGTYARGLFAASPLRRFALVIAVDHKQKLLRYLIFHHGGLSASQPLNLTDAKDCRAILKVLLSILLWQSPEDAGLPSFTDGHHFVLPHPLDGMFKIECVIHQALSTRGRNTYVARLKPLQNDDLKQSGISDTESADKPDRIPRYAFQRTTVKRKHSTEASTTSKLRSESKTSITPQPFSESKRSPASQPSGGSKRLKPNTQDASSPILQEVPNPQDADEAPRHPILPREKRFRSTKLEAVKPSRFIPTKDTDTLQFESLSSPIVIKCSWPNAAKEEVEPKMYDVCKEAFGAPKFLFSFAPCFCEGQPMSNSIFLPPEGEDRHWPLFRKPEADKPAVQDRRTLWITVLASEGKTLDECLSTSELCECLLHAILGWLSAYQNGYMHRDISIGNLLQLLEPVSCKGFNASKGLDHLFIQSGFNCTPPDELRTLAKELDDALTLFGLTGETTQCKAIFTDGDMAAYIPTYFSEKHDAGTLSGTTEFMSSRLLSAIRNKTAILQSPLDDMWSFFWTALWATLFNCHDQGKSITENNWRDDVRGQHRDRDYVAQMIRGEPIERRKEFSLMLRQMAPLLREWHKSLEEMNFKWAGEVIAMEESAAPADLLTLFHKYAHQGVLDFVHILWESDLLKQSPS